MAEAYGNYVIHTTQWRRFRVWIKLEITSMTATQCTVKRSIAVGAAYADYTGYSVWSGSNSHSGISINAGTSGAEVWSSIYTDSWTENRGTSSRTVSATAYASLANISGTSTATVSITIPAIANKHTVAYYSYDGGTALGSVQVTHGSTINLASTGPTVQGYKFIGWASSPNSSTRDHAPGASATINTDWALYAVYVMALSPPVITAESVRTWRVDQNGVETINGEYASFKLSVIPSVQPNGTTPTITSVTVKYRVSGSGSSYTTKSFSLSSLPDLLLSAQSGFSANSTYEVIYTVVDSNGASASFGDVLTRYSGYGLDIMANGVGFGVAAVSNEVNTDWPIKKTNDTDWDYIYPENYNGEPYWIRWRCLLNRVFVDCYFSLSSGTAISSTGWTSSKQIPPEYCPDETVGIPLFAGSAQGLLTVEPDGHITSYATSSSRYAIGGRSYPISN